MAIGALAAAMMPLDRGTRNQRLGSVAAIEIVEEESRSEEKAVM